ncbi:DNA polymerase III subunit beta [Candidatus Saccharibacteria bacterium]|nr:MAG: DNA polymerase III subunit beta [Candidatus Saccharibacteria bacterium]
MKLTISQEKFSKALNNATRIASSKNDLAVLNNILLRTDGNRLLIAATNLEMASKQYVGVKMDKPGSITVPARLLSDFVSSLPGGAIELTVKDNLLSLKTDNFSSVINGVEADEFPELPVVDEKQSVVCKFKSSQFKKSVSQTIVATSVDTSRPVLTGVFWHSKDGILLLAGTDGYRLAEKKTIKTKDDISAIIPASTLQEVLRGIDDTEGEVKILFDDTQVCFKYSDVEIISKLIDGKFPDYQQLIPAKSETEATLEKSDFSRITKIASLFARESGGGITLTASKEKNNISIHSIASELGENDSEAEAKVTSDGQITLNSRYLVDALNAIDGDKVKIAFSGKLSPSVISQDGDGSDYTHIIMPMKS